MDRQEQLRQVIKKLARNINTKRRDLVLAVRYEEYEQAAQLRDDARHLQEELIELVNKKTIDQY